MLMNRARNLSNLPLVQRIFSGNGNNFGPDLHYNDELCIKNDEFNANVQTMDEQAFFEYVIKDEMQPVGSHYPSLPHNRPFFIAKASFSRANSSLSLHFQ